MTTTINNALPPNNNTIELDQYYRLILGITLPDVNSLEYTAQYQKIYVDTLIDITTLTLRSSWPMEMSAITKEGQPVVNTDIFVRHLLKRSRATRSVLQLAIFYLFRIRPHIMQRSQYDPIVKCGRRMFLAALICAHKYLYDNTFTNTSWARISKLPVKEVNAAEKSLLDILDYRLYVPTEIYEKFESQLKEAMPQEPALPSPVINSNKRSLSSITTTNTISKKQKHNTHHIHHGIPTPEDDKVEFDF